MNKSEAPSRERKKVPILKKTQDKGLHPQLATEVALVRGGMAAAAEEVRVPERFTFEHDPDRPQVILRDRETGRAARISLCDYRGVRAALLALFGNCEHKFRRNGTANPYECEFCRQRRDEDV
jgi:hypothetical protein